MSLTELVHRLARLLALVVLGFSGMFVILYLLRWEWNRALIAGVFFLAAELYLLGDVVLGRIARLQAHVLHTEESDEVAALAAELRRTRPPPRGPFEWLEADRDRSYVLVPVLLGAGILLSGIAYVVERLSRVTAAPVAEHELARGLATMALPRTGLAPTGQAPIHDLDAPRPTRPVARRNTLVILALIVSLTAVIVTLAVVLVTRPAPPEPDAALVLDLYVARNNLAQSEESIAAALWGTCQLRLPADVALQSLEPQEQQGEPGLLRMVVAPAPAEFDKREFVGCLQDTAVDRAQVEVLEYATIAR
jgi:hypothetical protein